MAHDFEQLDHYQLLNVARGASLNEIKKAFRREITSYHPDRFVRASDEEKQYARIRSQRINEAFRILRDKKLREHYNLTIPGGSNVRPSQPVPTGPLAPRDHHAEMYETAKTHIEAGRLVQAVAVLRRLQQSNPFYRDVSTLLVSPISVGPASMPPRRHSPKSRRRQPHASTHAHHAVRRPAPLP